MAVKVKPVPVVVKPTPKIEAQTGFLIEKGIPIPAGRHNNGYPWDKLEIGDSFLIPDKNEVAQIGTQRAYHSKRLGRRFTARKEQGGGIRVWRVE